MKKKSDHKTYYTMYLNDIKSSLYEHEKLTRLSIWLDKKTAVCYKSLIEHCPENITECLTNIDFKNYGENGKFIFYIDQTPYAVGTCVYSSEENDTYFCNIILTGDKNCEAFKKLYSIGGIFSYEIIFCKNGKSLDICYLGVDRYVPGL